MKKMIAIDAGSTNCTLKIVYENGASEFIENELGKKITPVNILIGKKDGEEHTLIGEHAKDQSVIFPDRHFTNWKREMGSKKTIRIVDGKEYTPEILSGIMFKQKKKEAEEYCGSEIKEILITVPVTYNAMQKEAVKDAGVLAGFERDNIHIRLESDAAVKSADAHNDFRGSVCCLDCGGSTTDATVCNVTESEIRVQFTKGDAVMSGKNQVSKEMLLLTVLVCKRCGCKEIDRKYVDNMLKNCRFDTNLELPNNNPFMQYYQEAFNRIDQLGELSKKFEREMLYTHYCSVFHNIVQGKEVCSE